ncbi:hypothetical protein J4404_02385 [Candidatus Woesearchaeota archaeon]|nr:hypothetical protein [Candidatus Woesearchaeota archaeon]
MVNIKQLQGIEMEFFSAIAELLKDGYKLREYEGRYDYVKERIDKTGNIKAVIIEGCALELEDARQAVKELVEHLDENTKVFWFFNNEGENKIKVNVLCK